MRVTANLSDIWQTFRAWSYSEPILRILILLGVILPLLILLASVVGRGVRKRLSAQSAMLVRKAILYIGVGGVLVSVLYQLGFELTALLGAAGIVGIAIGFASQTSVSNVISGLFLISEKPFAVDDVIKVDSTVGIVLSIDLLSVKLRTFDNQLVRIPNETIIKTEVTNITRFPIRRLDIKLHVHYDTNVQKLRSLLAQIASENPHCLDEPEPLILFTDFGESGMEFLFGVWFAKADFLLLRNTIMEDIKARFDSQGVQLAFSRRTLYAGKDSPPFPVRVVEDQDPPQA
jgi:small-conductance mechanosensitive channel